MPAQQTAHRSSGLRRYGLSAALSALGWIIVLLVLHQTDDRSSLPASPPAPVLTARRIAMAPSARGATARLGEPGEGRFLSSRGSRSTPVPATVELPAPPTPTRGPTAAPTATPPRTEVIAYQVQPGDNLFLISQQFDLSQDTLAWANEAVEENPDQLTIGQELDVLPVDGVWHTVQPGETLAAIAERYGVDAQAIVGCPGNAITDTGALSAGQKLIVPGGSKPRKVRPAPAPAQPAAASGPRLMIPAGAPAEPVEAPAQPGRFVWPAQGIITQGYGPWHGAIDIANKQGTPILAADAGTVTFAGPSGGLGNAIQIDHGDGFATTYAHLYSIGVQVGQGVQQGEQIGLMGTTGHSTGPHLHFVVTYNGGVLNPLGYLQ